MRLIRNYQSFECSSLSILMGSQIRENWPLDFDVIMHLSVVARSGVAPAMFIHDGGYRKGAAIPSCCMVHELLYETTFNCYGDASSVPTHDCSGLEKSNVKEIMPRRT